MKPSSNDLQRFGDASSDAFTSALVAAGGAVVTDTEVGGQRAAHDRRCSMSVQQLVPLIEVARAASGRCVVHHASLRVQLYKEDGRAWNQVVPSGSAVGPCLLPQGPSPLPVAPPVRGKTLDALQGRRKAVSTLARPGSHMTPVAEVDIGGEPDTDRRWMLHRSVLEHLLEAARASTSQRCLIGKVCIRAQLWELNGHRFEVWHLYGAAAHPEVPGVIGITNADDMLFPTAMLPEGRR